MKRVWAFLSKPQNLAILVALGGGLGFLWKEVVAPKLNPKAETTASAPAPAPAVSQQATANGGTAINAAGQAQVATGADPTSAGTGGTAASMPRLSASQSAQAGSGGTAINATDSARVTVKRNASEK